MLSIRQFGGFSHQHSAIICPSSCPPPTSERGLPADLQHVVASDAGSVLSNRPGNHKPFVRLLMYSDAFTTFDCHRDVMRPLCHFQTTSSDIYHLSTTLTIYISNNHMGSTSSPMHPKQKFLYICW